MKCGETAFESNINKGIHQETKILTLILSHFRLGNQK